MTNRWARPSSSVRALFVSGAASLALLAGFATPAPASPGALRILIAESICMPSAPAATLRDQILDEPGVTSAQLLDGAHANVSSAELRSADLVVAIGDCAWLDPSKTGDRLADFEDGGGVVVGAGSDWRGGVVGALSGRWLSAGYSPYEAGSTPAPGFAALGWQDAGSPLLAGIPAFQDDEGGSPLSAYYRDSLALTGGAAPAARWTDGTPAVAVKGRAVGINAYLGDHYGAAAWNGNFGRLIVNAAEALGPRAPTEIGRRRGRCVVPNLRGLRLRAARRRLRHANCRVGRVWGSGHSVTGQIPKPGAKRAPGKRVALRLR